MLLPFLYLSIGSYRQYGEKKDTMLKLSIVPYKNIFILKTEAD